MRAAPSLPAAEQLSRGFRHAAECRALAIHHVLIELGRAADGLAGVVDDEVEPIASREQLVAEGLDAWAMSEVETEDLEPVAPVGEVRLLCVARRRVAGEAGGDDEPRPGPQELDPCLVADLDASA